VSGGELRMEGLLLWASPLLAEKTNVKLIASTAATKQT
jgi:hypothetical protein